MNDMQDRLIRIEAEIMRHYHADGATATWQKTFVRIAELEEALSELVWGCENGGMRPSPAFTNARRALGARDPLRFICGAVDGEEKEIISTRSCAECGQPLDNLQGVYLMQGEGGACEVCHRGCRELLEGKGYIKIGMAK